MSDDKPSWRQLRQRLQQGDHLLGTFVKIPTMHATEILGGLGFDFVVFDQEHAPLSISQLEIMIVAARASSIAGIVRVNDPTDGNILSMLDCGAAGIMVPHVATRAKAEAIAKACLIAGGTGASPTPRGQGGTVPHHLPVTWTPRIARWCASP